MKQKLKSSNKKKDDPLNLFGKYPNFPLDPKTYRNNLWERHQKLLIQFVNQIKKNEKKPPKTKPSKK